MRFGRLKRHLPYLGLLGGGVTLILWKAFFTFRPDILHRLRLPIRPVEGDGITVAMVFKSLMGNEWFPFFGVKIARLGAPFGQNQADYPAPENIYTLVIKFITLFSSDPFISLNFYYLLTYFLTAVAMYALCRSVRISGLSAVVVGILFAFLPYHFLRFNHLFLASYFLIPVMIGLLLRLWKLVPPFFERRPDMKGWVLSLNFSRIWPLLFWLFLFGSSGIYYSFFFCFLSVAIGISAALYRRSWPHLVSGILYAGITVGAVVLNCVPTVLSILKNSRNPTIAMRSPAEAEIAGMKLINLVMPPMTHRWPLFDWLRMKYRSGTPVVEGFDEYAGLVGLVGLVLLLVSLINPKGKGDIWRKLGVIVLLCFFMSTIGGLGAIIANWISPEFRSLNRISIFVCACGLVASAVLFDRARRHLPIWTFRFLMFAVLFLGVWDQCPKMMKVNDDGIARHLEDTKFFSELERKLPPGAMVMQIPFMEFPESPSVHKLPDYEHLRAFIYTEKLRFSYGIMKGREPSETLRQWSTPPLKLDFLRSKGFGAIYLDRAGFVDEGRAVEKALSSTLGPPIHVSGDGRRVCWVL